MFFYDLLYHINLGRNLLKMICVCFVNVRSIYKYTLKSLHFMDGIIVILTVQIIKGTEAQGSRLLTNGKLPSSVQT